MKRLAASPLFVAYLLLLSLAFQPAAPAGLKWTPTPTVTRTATSAPSVTPSATLTALPSATPAVAPPTATVPPFSTATPTVGAAVDPYPSAPLCADSGAAHDNGQFHTLWDAERGCHYDHEHGTDPRQSPAFAIFAAAGFDLYTLQGDRYIGHRSPSSPLENLAVGGKHQGFKIFAGRTPQGCVLGFEGATICIDYYEIQVHWFGDLSNELNTRFHSTSALMRQNTPDNDPGYVYLTALQDYGQRVTPYQNTIMPYPDNPQPGYASPLGPYWSADCVGTGMVNCRPSIEFILTRGLGNSSTITSKGSAIRTGGQGWFNLLGRSGDNYNVFDSADLEYPFTLPFICGGATYNPAGCRYNNSTITLQEVAGVLPATWDGLPWDSDPRSGRVTAEGVVNQFGAPVEAGACLLPGIKCYVVKLLNAYVGVRYGSELTAVKCTGVSTPSCNPDRDIYFNAAGQVVAPGAPGAVPSGWIGSSN